jgi:hypothetical protein
MQPFFLRGRLDLVLLTMLGKLRSTGHPWDTRGYVTRGYGTPIVGYGIPIKGRGYAGIRDTHQKIRLAWDTGHPHGIRDTHRMGYGTPIKGRIKGRDSCGRQQLRDTHQTIRLER